MMLRARRERLYARDLAPAGRSLIPSMSATVIPSLPLPFPRHESLQRMLSGAEPFAEPLTDAVKRLDHVEIVVSHFEFLAQPLDVAVDRPVIDIDLLVIGRIHQRVAALDHAGAERQRMQDQE